MEKFGRADPFTVTCPRVTIPEGGEVRCRLVAENETHLFRARRTGRSDIKIDPLRPTTR